MSTTPPNRSAAHPDWGEGWSVGLRAWVERAGQSVIGSEQLKVLEAIDRQHSIRAADRALGIPSRRRGRSFKS